MNRPSQTTVRGLLALSLISAGAAFARDYAIDWHTVDGGGEMWSAGGDYELGGTIGQSDAGAMTGGNFGLTGGFWALPPCWCQADINNDGKRNGDDVQNFVDCLIATGAHCACADVLTDGVLDMADVIAFVNGLLATTDCP